VVMMVRVPIEFEWMIMFTWIDCHDIHISAALSAWNSASVIGVWFGNSASDFFGCFCNETSTGCGFVCLGLSVSVDVDGWCAAFIKVDNSGRDYYCCAFRVNYLLDGVLYNYLNLWF